MFRPGKRLAWLIIPAWLLLLLAGSPAPVPPADPAWVLLGLREEGELPQVDLSSAAVDLAPAPPLPAWSRVAYQRYVNEQWDIYVDGPDGPRPVVATPVDERFPALDRGARRLAYSAVRNGTTADLFVAWADGRDERALVTDQLATAFPDWSPDGSQIVYQGLGQGQYDLFVIDVHSAERRRLTAHAAFDGEPRWSPDGRTILFTSDREDGVFYLHTVSAAGGAARRLNSLPYSLHPSWSPDGRRIGFDADTDGDGWQELAVMNADGSGQRAVYDPGAQATAWAGSWSPDGRYLSFTEIEVEFRNGGWVWVSGKLRTWDSETRAVRDLLPERRAWYPAWQPTDVTPPVSTLAPLPSFSRAGRVELQWAGADSGGSGLRSFDLLARVGGEAWRTVTADSPATSRSVRGRPGETVRYITRARDNAWNLEALREPWAQETTYYNTAVSGRLTDNRGTPLVGVPLPALPSLLFPLQTEADGRFQGYTGTVEAGAFQAAAANFLPLPPVVFPAEADFNRDLYLLPADTLLLNGQFEAGEGLPGWAREGTLAALARYGAASGRYAARLGRGPAGAAGTAVLHQTVTIPAEMPAPTLSFLARVAQGGGPQSGLTVRLLSGLEVEEWAVPLSDNWTQHWFDLGLWRGRTVQVAFILTQDAADTPLTVWLDDVALGSAGSELWLDLTATPPRALPGDLVTLRLRYGNRSKLDAGATSLALQLPPGVALLAAQPSGSFTAQTWQWALPELPGGEEGVITAVLQLQSTAAFSAPLRAEVNGTAFEALTENNRTRLTLSSGKVVYLPGLLSPPLLTP